MEPDRINRNFCNCLLIGPECNTTPVNGSNNIRKENRIDMGKCKYEMWAKCIGMCSGFFTEAEINKMYENLRNMPIKSKKCRRCARECCEENKYCPHCSSKF